MRIATLIQITEGEINGDVQTFDISSTEGMAKASETFSDLCRSELEQVEIFENGDYRHLTPDEIQEKLSEAIDSDYELDTNGVYIVLHWSELIGV